MPEGISEEVLIDSGAVKVRQGYGLDRTIELGFRDVRGRRGGGTLWDRIRVQIDRNAYDNQSSYKVSVWRDEGWAEVASIPNESPEVVALPSYVCFKPEPAAGWHPLSVEHYRAQHASCLDGVEAIARQLVDMAIVVLQP